MDRLATAIGTALAAGVAGLTGAFWTVGDTSSPIFWAIAGGAALIGGIAGATSTPTTTSRRRP